MPSGGRSYLQAYYDEHGDLRVPKTYEAPDGFRSGQLGWCHIRLRGSYVEGHPDRLTLQERGWVANVMDAKWEDAQQYLQAYYDEHGDLRVSTAYVSHDGFRSGAVGG